MEIIAENKYSQVYYDKEKNIYIKYFTPKLKKKIKYFFRLRKYPGENYNYISKKIKELGIKTPKIISYGKYFCFTENIDGKLLTKRILEEPDNEKIRKYIDNYINIIRKIIKNKIYYADFNFDNFIVYKEELYIIDLEDYKKDIFFMFKKKKMLMHLKKTLFSYEKILKNKGIDYKEIYLRINKN